MHVAEVLSNCMSRLQVRVIFNPASLAKYGLAATLVRLGQIFSTPVTILSRAFDLRLGDCEPPFGYHQIVAHPVVFECPQIVELRSRLAVVAVILNIILLDQTFCILFVSLCLPSFLICNLQICLDSSISHIFLFKQVVCPLEKREHRLVVAVVRV